MKNPVKAVFLGFDGIFLFGGSADFAPITGTPFLIVNSLNQ